MAYKWCIVPRCKNTSTKTPEKMFVSVPTDAKRRNKWLLVTGRNPTKIKASSNVFCCEDHFDVEKDWTNYMKYKMGFASKIILAPGAIPSKFDCRKVKKLPNGDLQIGSDIADFVKVERVTIYVLESQKILDTLVNEEIEDVLDVKVKQDPPLDGTTRLDDVEDGADSKIQTGPHMICTVKEESFSETKEILYLDDMFVEEEVEEWMWE